MGRDGEQPFRTDWPPRAIAVQDKWAAMAKSRSGQMGRGGEKPFRINGSRWRIAIQAAPGLERSPSGL